MHIEKKLVAEKLVVDFKQGMESTDELAQTKDVKQNQTNK